MGQHGSPFLLQPGADIDSRGDPFVRNTVHRLPGKGQIAQRSYGRVRVRGQVEGARLPGVACTRIEPFKSGCLDCERGHPVGVHMVWMTGQPTVGVVGDHDLRAKLPQLRDQPPHLSSSGASQNRMLPEADCGAQASA